MLTLKLVTTVNRQVCGWANYFDHRLSRPAFRTMNLVSPATVGAAPGTSGPAPLPTTEGDKLVCISVQAACAWRSYDEVGFLCDSLGVKAIRKHSAGRSHAVFDEGGQVNVAMVRVMRRRQTKRVETDRLDLWTRDACSPLYRTEKIM